MRPISATLCLTLLAGCAAIRDPYGIDSALRRHDDHAVQVAALVVDLDTGETLCSREARRLLRPASTMKLLTTAAICRRDPGGAVETVLLADAAPKGAVTLIGGGDPFCSSDELRDLVRELAQRGLTRVGDGAISVVDPLLDAPRFGEGWMWDDEPLSFMPPLSAVPIDGACVTVEARDVGGTVEAQLLPVAGPLTLTVQPGTGALRITRGLYREPHHVTVTGKLANGRPVRRRISVPEPARYTAAVLAAALAQEGLLDGEPRFTIASTVPEPSPTAPRASLRRPMAECVLRTNKDSDNLGAELLLRRLGSLAESAQLDGDTVDRGLALVREDLAQLGLDPDGYRIADGSGVSHYSLVTAEVLVAVLVGMHRLGGPGYEVFEASLPIAGRDGTLASRMRGTTAEGCVRAKTGTISGVSTLAGYVATKSGRNLAFAIMVQNFVGSAAPWRELQDEFCARLAEL